MSKRIVKKKMSRKKKLIITITSVVCVLCIIAGAALLYVNGLFGSLSRQELNQDNLDIYDDPNDIMWQYHDDIKNIALFGLDTRQPDENGRSDVNIIISINYTTSEVKLISIPRDLYVQVRGSKTKMGHAYAFGGAELAVSTLNNNFQLDIEDFVSVNFYGVAQFIEYIGGVEMDITEAERQQANINLREQRQVGMTDSQDIKGTGVVKLDGAQAVAYARIRNIDSDFGRSERQRKVIMATFEAIKKSGVSDLTGIAKAGLSACHTSLTNNEIVFLSTWLLGHMNDVTFKTESVPGTLCSYGYETIDELSYVTCNMYTARSVLKEFIYGSGEDETVPVPIVQGSSGKTGGGDTGTGK